MTPQEIKAREILIKMQFQKEPLKFEQAKQCAIIAVDEILNNVYKTPFRFTSVSSDELYRIEQECKHSLNMNILFLTSVKQEIEKL